MSTKPNRTPQEVHKETRPSKANDVVMDAYKELEELFRKLDPWVKFNENLVEAEPDDGVLYWDAKLLRGKDTIFAYSTGSSTLPGIFAQHGLAKAPRQIEQEILDKIILPLAGKMQFEVNRIALEDAADEQASLDKNDLSDDDLN